MCWSWNLLVRFLDEICWWYLLVRSVNALIVGSVDSVPMIPYNVVSCWSLVFFLKSDVKLFEKIFRCCQHKKNYVKHVSNKVKTMIVNQTWQTWIKQTQIKKHIVKNYTQISIIHFKKLITSCTSANTFTMWLVILTSGYVIPSDKKHDKHWVISHMYTYDLHQNQNCDMILDFNRMIILNICMISSLRYQNHQLNARKT